MRPEPGYGRMMFASVIVGVATALATAAFLVIEHGLHRLVWGHGEEIPLGWFSGSWQFAIVAVVALGMVGWLRRRWVLDGPDPSFVQEMVTGHAPLGESLKRGVLALGTLVSGASAGPEAPVAALGAGVGNKTARRMRLSEQHSKDLTFAGVSSVFGVLASFPFAAPIIALETGAGARFGTYARLLPGLVSATVALGLLYPLIGTPLMAVYDVGGDAPLQSWWLLAGAGLGVLGGVIGLGLTLAYGMIGAIGARIGDPVIRAVVGAVIISALGIALPLTMFSGRHELEPIIAGAVGGGMILAAAVAKVATLAISLRWGGFGGAIFPLLFIGGAFGALVHVLVPAIPLVVAVPAMAASVTAMMVPLPLMIIVLVILLFGLRLDVSAVPAAAVVTAYLIGHMTGLRTKLLGEPAQG